MKTLLIVTLLSVSGFANAGSAGCEAGASKFVEMVQNQYTLGFSRSAIEQQMTSMGGPQMGQMAAKIAGVLYNAPKGGWTQSELENQKRSFVRGACN